MIQWPRNNSRRERSKGVWFYLTVFCSISGVRMILLTGSRLVAQTKGSCYSQSPSLILRDAKSSLLDAQRITKKARIYSFAEYTRYELLVILIKISLMKLNYVFMRIHEINFFLYLFITKLTMTISKLLIRIFYLFLQIF